VCRSSFEPGTSRTQVKSFTLEAASLTELMRRQIYGQCRKLWAGLKWGTVQFTGARRAGRGPEYDICLCLSLEHHYSSIAQINPLRPRPGPSHSCNRESVFPDHWKDLQPVRPCLTLVPK